MVNGNPMGKGLHEHRVLVRDAVQLLNVLRSACATRPVSVLAAQLALLNVAKERRNMLCSAAAALYASSIKLLGQEPGWS